MDRRGFLWLGLGGAVALLAAGACWRSYAAELERARARIGMGSVVFQSRFGAMEYAVAGEGPPAIVIHGTGGGFDQEPDPGPAGARELHGQSLHPVAGNGHAVAGRPVDCSVRLDPVCGGCGAPVSIQTPIGDRAKVGRVIDFVIEAVDRVIGETKMRIAAAATLYFAIVFGVGFVLGPIRVLWLEPRVGPLLAALSEAPFLLAAMVVAAHRVPRVVKPRRTPATLVLMGAGALVLQQVADFAVGIGLRGVSPSEQLAQFATGQGMVYAALLVMFAAMPLLLNPRSARLQTT